MTLRKRTYSLFTVPFLSRWKGISIVQIEIKGIRTRKESTLRSMQLQLHSKWMLIEFFADSLQALVYTKRASINPS